MNILLFFKNFCTCSSEIIDIFPCVEKNFNVAFFSDTVKVRSFKFCMIITLLKIYIFIVDLMILMLSKVHRCVRNINCRLCFLASCLGSCLLQFQCFMVATYIKKIMLKSVSSIIVCGDSFKCPVL